MHHGDTESTESTERSITAPAQLCRYSSALRCSDELPQLDQMGKRDPRKVESNLHEFRARCFPSNQQPSRLRPTYVPNSSQTLRGCDSLAPADGISAFAPGPSRRATFREFRKPRPWTSQRLPYVQWFAERDSSSSSSTRQADR